MNESAASKKPVGLALLLGGAWLLALGLIFLVTLGREETWELGLFLGRFHILIVHVPIGLLCFAGILELAGYTKWFRDCRSAVFPTLWVGMLGALAATFVGFIFFRSEDIAGNSMTMHLWTGLAVALGSILCLIFKLLQVRFVYEGTLLTTIVLVAVTSHFGGNMVHSPEYLTEYAPDAIKPLLGHKVEEVPETEDLTALQIYPHLLQPIFDAKCVECHSAEKIKGDLRMDSFEELAKGGDLGEEFVPGDAEASELIFRVTLPTDDDEFMPPDEKEPMTPAEIRLMAWWIDTGASPTMTVAEGNPDEEIMTIIQGLMAGDSAVEEDAEATADSESEAPSKPVSLHVSPSTPAPAELEEGTPDWKSVKAEAAKAGLEIAPMKDADGLLAVEATQAQKVSDKSLALLQPLATQIGSLNLAGSRISGQGIQTIATMTNLEYLNLEHTRIDDTELEQLAGLTGLSYINLYKTDVTNHGLQHLAGMNDLRHLYLWQTDSPLSHAEAIAQSKPQTAKSQAVAQAEARRKSAP